MQKHGAGHEQPRLEADEAAAGGQVAEMAATDAFDAVFPEALALAGDQVMPLFEEDGEVVKTNEQSCDGHFIDGRGPFVYFLIE